MRDVTRGNCLTLVAAVFARTVIAIVFRVDFNPHGARLHLRAGEKRHTGGVVVHGGQVVADDAGAGVGAARTEARLFRELKTGGRSGLRGKRGGGQKSGGSEAAGVTNSGHGVPSVKSLVNDGEHRVPVVLLLILMGKLVVKTRKNLRVSPWGTVSD